MKNFHLGIHVCIILSIFSSCDNEKKSPENGSVYAPMDQSSAKKEKESKQQDRPEGTQATVNEQDGEVTGKEVVENACNKLNDKLNLSESQFKSLNEILTKTFVESGGELDGKYKAENTNKMGRALRQKASGSIDNILDTAQRERFEKFMHK